MSLWFKYKAMAHLIRIKMLFNFIKINCMIKFFLLFMKKMAFFGCFFLLVILVSSCKSLGYKMMGVKKLEGFDKQTYESFMRRLPEVDYVDIVGEAEQFWSVMSLTSDSTILHRIYQPIQILYFDKDSLVSFHVNCTAPSKGFNLDWNYQGRFESFPPHSPLEFEVCPLSLGDYRSIYTEIEESEGYSVIVFWTNMLYKFSRSAILSVVDNLKIYGQNLNIKLYLINNDKFFSQAEF